MAFIGIDRGIVEHWIYKDAEYFKVWFEMLYRARYSKEPKTDKQGDEIYTIHYGEFMYGRPGWSQRLGVSEQRLRTLMKLLIKADMISLVSNFRKFSIYRITNYEKFNQQNNQQENYIQQGIFDDANQQINLHSTSSQPAANQQPTTKEQCKEGSKKVKKVKKEITYSDEFLTFWDSYPKQIGQQAAFTNWNKLIKALEPSYLIACGMNYASYVVANETEYRYIKQPNNFLNAKEEYYKQYETPVLIHSRKREPEKQMDKLQQIYAMAEEEERRAENRGYQAY